MTLPPRQLDPQSSRLLPGQSGPVGGPKLRTWLVGGIALVLVLGGYWYFNGRDSGGARPSNAAPVRVAKVEQRDMAVVERSLGTVVANTLVQLSARVQGTIMSANFQEGQYVKKGDLLFPVSYTHLTLPTTPYV